MRTEIAIVLAIFFIYWTVNITDYILEKRRFRSRSRVDAVQRRSSVQWIMDKLHLPREKYVKDMVEQNGKHRPKKTS